MMLKPYHLCKLLLQYRQIHTSNTDLKIAILGAGVGGLFLARALRALDVPCTVYERRTTLVWPVDRGLGLWDASQARD